MSNDERIYTDYISDIVNEIKRIEEFTNNFSYEDFTKDEKTIYAVIRCFEIIGEAVKKIPLKVRNEYPDVPWKNMAGMRDKLIHEYFGVDHVTLWETVKIRIPQLKPLINLLLEKLRELYEINNTE